MLSSRGDHVPDEPGGSASQSLTRRQLLRSSGLAGLTLFSVGLLDACSSSKSSGGGAGNSTSPSATANGSKRSSFTISIAVFPNSANALPFVVAVSKPELWAKHGLSLGSNGVLATLGGSTVVRNLTIGKLDFGCGSSIAAVNAYQAGVAIQAIAGYNGGNITWIVKKDSPIQSVEQLAGKKMSITSTGSTTHASALLILDKVGLLDKVEIVTVGDAPSSFAALEKGLVDAAWQNTFSQVPYLLSGQARQLAIVADYAPDFPDDWLITGVPTVDKDPDFVGRFVTAYKETGTWIADHLDDAAAMYASMAKISSEAAKTAVNSIPKGYFDPGIPVGQLESTQKAMKLMDAIKKPVSGWQDLVNTSFLGGSQAPIPSEIPFPS